MSTHLLEVKNLKMYYKTRKGSVKAVDDVSFNLDCGQLLGLIGESGCGKTSVALSIMRLLPNNGIIIDGQILFDGVDLLKLSSNEMRKVLWDRISMIFQGAMNALDPVYRVADLLVEALRVHRRTTRKEAKRKVAELFELVGLPPSRMNSYPHELSGGMKQRVMIAMSLICDPGLVIADEPHTALDVVVQDQILNEIKDLQKKLNLSMIMITHDISVVMETCNKIVIMYGGKVFEKGEVVSIFKNPRNPYTRTLLQAFPRIRGPLKMLASLPGEPPSLLNPPPKCRFEPRCPVSKEICRKEEPPFIEVTEGHYSRCHFALDL